MNFMRKIILLLFTIIVGGSVIFIATPFNERINLLSRRLAAANDNAVKIGDDDEIKITSSQCAASELIGSPPRPEEMVNCRACRNKTYGIPVNDGINFVATLPYFNKNFASQTHDIGYYKLLDSKMNPMTPSVDDLNNPSERSIGNYIQSIAIYVAILMIILHVFIFCSCCFCIGRYCLCCCCKGGPCCCGKIYPTKPFYSNCDRNCTKLCMLIFVGGFGYAVYFGHMLGSVGLTDGQIMLVKSPTTMMNVVQSTSEPVQGFLEDFVGDSFVTTMRDVNQTFAENFDVKGLLRSLKCIDEMVANLPKSEDMMALAVDTTRALDGLPDSNHVVSTLTALNVTISKLPNQVKDLNTSLIGMDAGVKPLKDLSGTKSNMKTLNTTMIKTKNGINGVQTNITKLFNGVPTNSTITESKTKINNIGPKGGVTATVSASDNATAFAWRTEFKNFLTEMKTNISGSPDPLILSSDLKVLNGTLDDMVLVIDNITKDIGNLKQKINDMPPINNTIIQLQNLSSTVDGFNATAILEIVQQMNASVALMPNLTMVEGFIDSLKLANQSTPCLDNIPRILNKVNETLIWLPESFGKMTNQVEDVKKSIRDALNETENIVKQLSDLNESLSDLPNFTKVTNQIISLNNESKKFEDLNITNLINSLQQVENSTNIDFDSILDTAKNISNLLKDNSSRPTTKMCNSISDMNDTVVNLPLQIDSALDGFKKWEGGYCEVRRNATCEYDYDCNAYGGGICNTTFAARYPAVCRSSPLITCSNNSDCPKQDCPWPDFSKVLKQLDDFDDVLKDTPDTGEMTNQLKDSVKSIDDMPNLQEKINDISNVEKEIEDMPNISDYTSTLSDLDKQLKDVPDVDDMIRQWKSVNESVNGINRKDIDALKNQSKDLNKTKQDYKTNEGINDAKDTMDYLDDFLYTNFNKFLIRMSRPALKTAGKRGGLSETLNTIVDTMNDLINDVMGSGLMGGNATNTNITITDAMKKMLDNWEDRDNNLRKFGSIYYFINLQGGNSSNQYINGHEGEHYPDEAIAAEVRNGKSQYMPTVQGVYNKETKSTYLYEGDKLCVSDECLENEILMINREDINIGGQRLGISREILTLCLYALPLLVVLCGMCGCLSKKSCPSMTTACCSMVCSPCMLYFFGMIFILLVMIPHDVCYSVENIGYNTIKTDPASFCADSLNGVYDEASGTCMEIPFPGNMTNKTVTMNVAGAYKEIFDDCEGDFLNEVYNSFAEASGDIASTQIDKAIDPEDQEDKEGSLRPTLKKPFKDGGKRMGKDITKFVKETGSKLSCKHVNRMYYDVKEAVCCGIFNGLFNFIGSWVTIGLLMMFCACPAGIRGYKRFPTNEYVEKWHRNARRKYYPDEDSEDSDEDDDYEEKGAGGAGDIEMRKNPLGYNNVKSWND
jgi:hypothetical protein